jgi:transcriptional regulator with XRE-family HTH domain
MATTTSPMMLQASFGELLRRWRRSQGLKQIELGRLLKPRARAATVSCWENGIRRPSRKYISQIVDLTGIPADFVLGVPPREGHRETLATTAAGPG